MNQEELQSRFNILCQKYAKDLLIEAKTLQSLCNQHLLPSAFSYRKELATGLAVIQQVGCPASSITPEKRLLDKLNDLSIKLHEKIELLEAAIKETEHHLGGHAGGDDAKASQAATIRLRPLLGEVRALADEIEENMSDESYPLPKYSELLFN